MTSPEATAGGDSWSIAMAAQPGLPGTRALLPQHADFTAMRRDPKRDVIAGVTVAFVGLPLALAFEVASGMGAAAGLATAIVAGVVAAVVVGSNLPASGPTGAMTVVLLPIVAQVGARAVLVVGMMAGLLLVVLAYAGASRYPRHIPLPVVEGFTLGIAVIIGLKQAPAVLGATAEVGKVLAVAFNALREWLASPGIASLAVTPFLAGRLLLTVRYRPGSPMSLAVAALYALGRVAKSARVDVVPLDLIDHTEEGRVLLKEHVVAYRLDGPVFFGAGRRFLLEVSEVRVVILRLSRVQALDAGQCGRARRHHQAPGRSRHHRAAVRHPPDRESAFQVLGAYDHLPHERHIFTSTLAGRGPSARRRIRHAPAGLPRGHRRRELPDPPIEWPMTAHRWRTRSARQHRPPDAHAPRAPGSA